MNPPRFHAVVPAAGRGVRMDAERPKQYLPLAGATVIEYALRPLLDHPGLESLVVCLAADDDTFASLPATRDSRIVRAPGGASRAASVRSGLRTLAGSGVPADATVLVHDAARPCLGARDLDRLLTAEAPEGALLATPVADTLKREQEGGSRRVAETVARNGLWRALTPQRFPLGLLSDALDRAGDAVTDESQAMEDAGYHPLLVPASALNIKVTRPGDLELAAALLALVQADTSPGMGTGGEK